MFSLADELSFLIYQKTLSFVFKHQNSIDDQLRRASLSISLTLVEGEQKLQKEKEINTGKSPIHY